MKEQTIFPPEILREIHFRTQGIPSVINAICDNLLLTAFALESKVADCRDAWTRSPPICAWNGPANDPSVLDAGFAGRTLASAAILLR